MYEDESLFVGTLIFLISEWNIEMLKHINGCKANIFALFLKKEKLGKLKKKLSISCQTFDYRLPNLKVGVL